MYAGIANPSWKITPRMFYDFYRCASRLFADVDEVLGLKVTPERVLRLAEQREESEVLEYKSEISNTNDFLKSVIAFANKRGGDILIGVEDNGDILGVSDRDLAGRGGSCKRGFCQTVFPQRQGPLHTKGRPRLHHDSR